MQVDGATLASELRRRRVRPRTMLSALGCAERCAWVPGDLRAVPTSLLVLAALSLTGGGPSGPGPAAAPRRRSPG